MGNFKVSVLAMGRGLLQVTANVFFFPSFFEKVGSAINDWLVCGVRIEKLKLLECFLFDTTDFPLLRNVYTSKATNDRHRQTKS